MVRALFVMVGGLLELPVLLTPVGVRKDLFSGTRQTAISHQWKTVFPQKKTAGEGGLLIPQIIRHPKAGLYNKQLNRTILKS